MICYSCGAYFKPNKDDYPKKHCCSICTDAEAALPGLEEDIEIELGIMVNPSGRVRAMIYDDRSDEDFSI
jgi:hypothetical protein